ncbi:glutamyl-Q tRNA(Asp) synthetase [Patescibacteria group bacterium]|nr:glutamyl-Q tRNA(Asp) synthetase [Patescibacteria group bacterium]
MSKSNTLSIIGRFAPSPTGALHLGSLYTALASYLQAKSQQGQWRLRIDDLDTPRNVKGAVSDILNTLETFGLHWDGKVVYQSQCLDIYQQALHELQQKQQIYACACSRKDLETTACTCRNKFIRPDTLHALRIKTDEQTICFNDNLQGLVSQVLHDDFVLKRKDNIIAYQFAVVLDDYQQGVNQVVRGFDLLYETPKQIYLQQLLKLSSPDYFHVPVIVDAQGYKLSKQTRATAVNSNTPEQVIFNLLKLLKQQPPKELNTANVFEQLNWAVKNWKIEQLKNVQQVNI